MKTPETWACLYWGNEEIEFEDIAKQIQDEAYNEAIEAAAKNAKTKTKRVVATNGYSFNIEEVDVESILELKK